MTISKQQLKQCKKCRKLIASAERRASFTTFLFQENRCKCFTNEPQTVAPEATEIETQFSSTEKPNLGHDWEPLELVGEGGMGSVWKARSMHDDRIAAVKVLRADLVSNVSAVRRFEQEIHAVSSLNHINLVAVHGSGKTTNGQPFIVMDYIEGPTLESLLNSQSPMPLPTAIDVLTQILYALEYAHSNGIIHRDLKPSNIIVAETGGAKIVKVVDFGIAKALPTIMEQTNNLTQSGELLGSPLYMSPEQCQGEDIDQRSDIYSFGCVMYEILTGKQPFSAANPIKTILKHLNDFPKPFPKHLKKLPGLEMICMRCLEKDPFERYHSVTDVLNDLMIVKENKPLVRARLYSRRRMKTELIKIGLIVSWISIMFGLQNLLG